MLPTFDIPISTLEILFFSIRSSSKLKFLFFYFGLLSVKLTRKNSSFHFQGEKPMFNLQHEVIT